MNPAAFQAARALDTVDPTRVGTVSHVAVGLGVGAGVGVGRMAVGVGDGVGVGVGVGVGDGVGVRCSGVGVGRGVVVGSAAPPEGNAEVSRGIGDAAPDDAPATDRPGLAEALKTAPPPSGTRSVPPAGGNWFPTMMARAETARTKAPTAIGVRRCLRHPVGAAPHSDATTAAAAPVNEMPQPGHAPAASAQHQGHAYVSHDGQWHSPTLGPIVALSICLPQRWQKGWGGSPESRAGVGTLIVGRRADAV